MPAVFSHENAVFWGFLVICSSFQRFFFGTCWYNIQKKNLEINQIPKNCWKIFLQHLLNFCNKSNTFCVNHFLKKRGFSCFVPIFVPKVYKIKKLSQLFLSKYWEKSFKFFTPIDFCDSLIFFLKFKKTG